MVPPLSPTRVVLLSFALPRYRLAVFRELAATPGIELKVVYGSVPGLENVAPLGFVAEPAKVRRLRMAGSYLAWDGSQWRYARKSRCDVLFLVWNTRYLSLVPSLLRARLGRVKTVLWGHGYSRRERWWRRRVRRAVAALADAVVFYGPRQAEEYAAASGRGEATFVALNTIDQEPIRRATLATLDDPGRLAAFREREGLDGRELVLFVSRYKRANRADLLIAACPRLRELHPGLLVVFIGEGFAEAGLPRQAADLGLDECVRFLGPIYDEPTLAPWFLSARLMCYPSNLGLSVLHAFGYGVPVVVGDDATRHPPEYAAVHDGVNSLTFREGDVSALTSAVDRILSDPGLRDRLGAGALRTATEDYPLRAMVDGLRDAVAYCRGQRETR